MMTLSSNWESWCTYLPKPNMNEINFIGDVHLNGFIVEKSEDEDLYEFFLINTVSID